MVSVPLRGVGCFRQGAASATGYQGFPSPCGVWVVSMKKENILTYHEFPSPCGVWVVSSGCKLRHGPSGVSVPLRGVGCFKIAEEELEGWMVSVPLRGVGCFSVIVSIFIMS